MNEVLRVNIAAHGFWSQDVARTRLNIANVHAAQGNYDKAVECLNNALKIFSKIYNKDQCGSSLDVAHIYKR